MQRKHFVLVHGACHGAWCWYRLQSLLEAEGHRVTAIDLGASGINPKSLDELRTFSDYTLPLFEVMESILPDEKVVLVGHSLGGLNMAFAMEKYPHKISVAVFIAAVMPDTVHTPIYLVEKDVVLARMLMRPISNFWDDLSKKSAFSNESYGSIKRAYIIPSEDKTLKLEFQRWQIETAGATIVKEIKDADHMAMISKPYKLCQYLLDIAWDNKGPRPCPVKDPGRMESEEGREDAISDYVYYLIYILFIFMFTFAFAFILFKFKF